MMLSPPPLPLKLAGIASKAATCRPGWGGCGGDCWLDGAGVDKLSDKDGGWSRVVALFRSNFAILEDGGRGRMGIGMRGLGELLSCSNDRFSIELFSIGTIDNGKDGETGYFSSFFVTFSWGMIGVASR